MKTQSKIIALISLLVFTYSVSSEAQKVKLITAEDSLSYALGVANYEYYKSDSIVINVKAFNKGMTDASKAKATMNETDASEYVMNYMQARETMKMEAEYKSQIDQARGFMAENSIKEGVKTTPSGLQYKVITEGTGEKPTSEDKVRVHYTGTTTDGKKFDSSYDRNEPAEFRLSGVIKGFSEGIMLMPVGSKYIFYLPYDLAYGERGAGGIIKPFENLIFEVELIEIVKE